jgi:hypothetical protein
MPSSGMLHRMAVVRTDVSEERIVSIIRITRIGRLGTTLVVCLLVIANIVPSSQILVTPMTEAIRASETSVVSRTTRRHSPEDGIFHNRRREDLRSYTVSCVPNLQL